jgi:hypothetical protein
VKTCFGLQLIEQPLRTVGLYKKIKKEIKLNYIFWVTQIHQECRNLFSFHVSLTCSVQREDTTPAGIRGQTQSIVLVKPLSEVHAFSMNRAIKTL